MEIWSSMPGGERFSPSLANSPASSPELGDSQVASGDWLRCSTWCQAGGGGCRGDGWTRGGRAGKERVPASEQQENPDAPTQQPLPDDPTFRLLSWTLWARGGCLDIPRTGPAASHK
ncbi:hypothetical protein J1605_010835 [Eschrichtius robustus]|uniref:Uncharacterized protein n=1 Tax=Eschrichtius robustus TaxID=9764 RepID=A0AB34GM13_ESCRO|nr:hypothetical protein J1605_010835 [Eschrichtius robustus]